MKYISFGAFALLFVLSPGAFATSYFSPSPDAGFRVALVGENADQISYWGESVGSPATITYSFATDDGYSIDASRNSTFSDATEVIPLSDFMPTGYKQDITRAFDAWSAVSGLTFTEVPDTGVSSNSPNRTVDIRIGGVVSSLHYASESFFPSDEDSVKTGDIYFLSSPFWQAGQTGAGYGWYNIFSDMLYSIGNSIGLFDYVDDNGLFIAEEGLEAPNHLSDGAIAGAQYLYGPPVSATAVPSPANGSLFLLALVGLVGGVLWQRSRRDDRIDMVFVPA